jgi:hypothetical protein
MKCNNDPFYSSDIATQLARAYDITHSANNVQMNCTGGGGNASASIGIYGTTSAESLSWGGWLTSVYNSLGWPICDGTNGPNCRWAAEPWPWSQAAGIVWHEASHQEQYTHGANDQAAAKIACGYPSFTDDQWHFQVNTMPYIIGNCASDVIDRSGQTCGALETCGPNALKIIDTYGGSTCSCIADPSSHGIGALGMPAGSTELKELMKTSNGDWMDGWHLGGDNWIVALGDFNGDGSKDFAIASPWGFGFITGAGRNMRHLAMAPWGTWVSGYGWWQLHGTDVFGPVGDFNGDGKEDLVVRSSSGFAILTIDGSGNFQTLNSYSYGTWLGSWYLQSSNDFLAAGDFNGNGRADLLVRNSSWGIGFLERDLGGNVSSWNNISWGSCVGGGGSCWTLTSTDQLYWVGDFDGNGTKDIVVRSPSWGWGILSANSLNNVYTLNLYPYGTFLGGWNLGAGDMIRAVGDFNGDKADDLVIQSGWGVGVLYRNGANFQHLAMTPYGDWMGWWHLGGDNWISGAGDFDGDGRSEFVIHSAWGTGLINVNLGGSLDSLWTKPFNSIAGGWWLTTSDWYVAVGDIDGDGRADLLLER